VEVIPAITIEDKVGSQEIANLTITIEDKTGGNRVKVRAQTLLVTTVTIETAVVAVLATIVARVALVDEQ
jgi:hypothetical protein